MNSKNGYEEASQPMTEPCDEVTWAQMLVGHLRHVAGAVLAEPTP